MYLQLVLIACILSGCRSSEPKVERSEGRNQAALADYVRVHTLEMHLVSAKLWVVTDGQLGILGQNQTWTARFAVGVGDRFQTQPDHHGVTSFDVERMDSASVLIRYSSRFDHRSFGNNLITIDEGEFEVPLR